MHTKVFVDVVFFYYKFYIMYLNEVYCLGTQLSSHNHNSMTKYNK